MASPSLLLFLFAVSLLTAGAAARPGIHFHPCKSLFISYTFTTETFDLPQIAAPRNPSPSSSSSGSYFAVYRVFRPLRSTSSSSTFAMPIRNRRPMIVNHPRHTEMVQVEPSFGMSSLQERAKDILVVVAGLLFGVGCGALTGAIMYLAWSLFTNRYELCRYGDDEEEEEEESPMKMGYIKIAEPVSAKEGYEGN